jgi:hypothetical protein
MRHFNYLLLSLFLLFFAACNTTENQVKTDLFKQIPPQSSYMFKVNKLQALQKTNPLIFDTYLDDTDKEFLRQSGLKLPFAIHILQQNSKIKGFIAIGNMPAIDSVFNGQTTQYEQFDVMQQSFNKKDYYATQINDATFISNKKLFI